MNIAIIFAGGTGQRMHSTSLPKQFLQVHGKPIIVHTIQKFQECPSIDKIVVVSLNAYLDYMHTLKEKFQLTKIGAIVSGGSTGQSSIYQGLLAAKKISPQNDTIVLIHDGVRPVIDSQTIQANIECVRIHGNAITVSPSTETVLISNDTTISDTIDRSHCFFGRAPQSFYLDELLEAHKKSIEIQKNDFIDSAMLMHYWGKQLYYVQGPSNNLKITTPMDFYMFKAILDAKESEQIQVL